MPTEQQLIEALRKADAAGDTAAASRFATLIKETRAGGGAAAAPPSEQGFLSPLASMVHGAARAVPFARQAGAAMEAAIPGLRPGSFGERYQAIRAENEGVADQNPVAAGVGTAAGIAGQVALSGGGALLNPRTALQAARGMVAAVPAGVRSLGTRAGAAAAARAAPVGAAAGVGLGNADIPLAQGRAGDAARQALGDAGRGAALAGGAGALAQGAKARAARAVSTEAAARAPVERVIAAEAEAATAAAGNKTARAAHRAEVARVRGVNKEIGRAHAEAVAAAKAAARGRTQLLERAARERANAALPSRSLETLGLDTARGRSMLGGPLRAAEEAPRIAQTPVPELGVTYGELSVALEKDPVKLGKVVQEVRQRIGARIGAVRTELAGTKARTPAQPILSRVDDELGKASLPRESRVEAAAAVRGMLEKARGEGDIGVQLLDHLGKPIRSARSGELTAAQLRKFIEDVDDSLGFSAGPSNMQRILGDRSDGVLLAARDAAVEAEKGLVAAYKPGSLEGYLDDVAAYKTARTVEHGAQTKISRPEGKGTRRPAPEKVTPAEPALLQRPVAAASPVAPMPRDVPKVSQELRAAETAALNAAGDTRLKAAGRVALPGIGAAVGGAIGSAAAGYPGAAAGATVGATAGRTLANRFLRIVRPSRAEFLAGSDKVLAALEKHRGVIEAAQRAGPRVANSLHRALIANDPQYAEAFNEKARRGAPVKFEDFAGSFRAGSAGRGR